MLSICSKLTCSYELFVIARPRKSLTFMLTTNETSCINERFSEYTKITNREEEIFSGYRAMLNFIHESLHYCFILVTSQCWVTFYLVLCGLSLTKKFNFKVSIVKAIRCTISQFILILEWYTLHVSDSLSGYHQEYKTVHTASYHTGMVHSICFGQSLHPSSGV